jgi:hypothetical protein
LARCYLHGTAPVAGFAHLFAVTLTFFRVNVPLQTKSSVCGLDFVNFGTHHNKYELPYLNFAVAIGTTRKEIDEFFLRLEHCASEFQKIKAKALAMHQEVKTEKEIKQKGDEEK